MDIIDFSQDIQKILLLWFSENGRHWIPWKLKKDGSIPNQGERLPPYEIWIAEVMLQQTQLKVVIPYWEKWMETFPYLSHLAEADLQNVLLIWQGLGYYSRAKRIHQSSKILLEYIGKNRVYDPYSWPIGIDEWMALPGIGRSTAGSIISSAFDLPAPILDGNVKRIFSRLLASEQTSRKYEKKLWELSAVLLSVDRPRDFNQALMDFGSIVCTPQKPNCSFCPLKKFCIAYIKYDPKDFPKREMKKINPLQEIGIGLVFNEDGELLIDQRLENSSMGGMWEFPGGKKTPDESIEQTIEREIQEELGIFVKVGAKLLSFEHAYSHMKLYFTVHLCEWKSGLPKPLASQNLLWVSPEKLWNFPFPAANTKIISELHKHLGIGNK
ncbi:A/G-specific adenine glycosylase [Prochlorococcus marinus]|uniref:Adenine DNA glycosylase n=1 Tax=Prochlorococcus marinus XMU1408 TaxID=2213228 RepID=A0A318QVW9_PROMR|nr:A/G-specific adenine glycosylase [Prochlorococcus marinus]MBW3042854.1 A/G-specific adenine glycosylase [Prochlorococcus marinus str. XMU1408]PYE00680.1 A/G-specific adenine glycosylase [Prochlorococcus marinus XMU1408]